MGEARTAWVAKSKHCQRPAVERASHLIQKTSAILLIFLSRTNEQANERACNLKKEKKHQAVILCMLFFALLRVSSDTNNKQINRGSREPRVICLLLVSDETRNRAKNNIHNITA